ncbi:2-dehydropantoate 2-reductase [Sinomonas sp. ASV486]|uniref:ketopantoate reductase family protein n=1 Tax=Sinomonas sp. ASV486 TaxID=3051170 RepID=UPI0027DC7783|nr:2-dehydropantoate 2-reductase [Sinomonas sp. ASV486]MDQ4489326.1 2-dehydropantoate 2-reductase [Sinomonas sp. ASV486]
MRILIAGAGATGGYFGARLAQAGRDVTFLVRSGRAEQLSGGLRLIGTDSDETVQVRALTAEQLDDGPYDLVMLAVKASALETVLGQLGPAIGPETLVLPILNGMRHLRLLNDRFGTDRVLGGSVRVVTHVTPDGAIRQVLPLAEIVLGAQPGGPAARADDVGRELSVPGYKLRVTQQILTTMWHKWAFIVASGVGSILMRASFGEIAAMPEGRDFIREVLAETEGVLNAAGYPASDSSHRSSLEMLTQPGSPFVPSLYRDFTEGREHEGEHLVGDFAATARELGVETPLTDLALLQLRVHDRAKAADRASGSTATEALPPDLA